MQHDRPVNEYSVDMKKASVYRFIPLSHPVHQREEPFDEVYGREVHRVLDDVQNPK